MTCFIHADAEQWGKLSKGAYKEIKKELAEEMFLEIPKVLLIQDYLLYPEAGTLIMYKRFIGKFEVCVFPLIVGNAIIRTKSVDSL